MKVELVLYEDTHFVLKSFSRQAIIENEARRVEVVDERDLLKATSFPNLNRLVQTTKDDDWLCLLLELAEGLDAVSLLRAYKRLDSDLVKLILLQVRPIPN